MKKIIILCLIFISSMSFSQGSFTIGNNEILKDSSGKAVTPYPFWFQNYMSEFGNGTNATLNFHGSPSLDEALLFQLNGTNILEFSNDSPHWDFKFPISINGVAISSGGGDAYLANRQTFTHRNIFSDTLKADGLSLMEQVRIADWFQVTGDVISNFMFIKGSRVFTGTADNYGYVIKTADTNRLVIDSLGAVTINKSLAAGTYILATDSVSSLQMTANNIYLGAVNSSVNWRIYGSRYYEGINSLNAVARTHTWQTKNGNNQIAQLDSSSGFNLGYGVFTGNGSGLTNVDAVTLKGQDTTNYAHTTTGTTENFLSKVIFSALVTFQTTSPVFNIAAVFNVLQDFANGLTTTTLTASGTATFNGDMVNTGWKKIGANNNVDKYTRDTVIRLICDSVQGGATQIAHGISSTKYIDRWTCTIRDDSAGGVYTPGCFYAPYLFYAVVTSTNCRIEFNGSSNTFKRDTAKFYITYSDYNR